MKFMSRTEKNNGDIISVGGDSILEETLYIVTPAAVV